MTFQRKNWRPWQEAAAYVRRLGIRSQAVYQKWSRSGARPADIPSNPLTSYGVSWAEFLGVRPRSTDWRPFEEAREIVRALQLPTSRAYKVWVHQKGPSDFPREPEYVYRDEWLGWPDFLHSGSPTWLSVEELQEIVQAQGIHTFEEYQEARRAGRLPPDAPGNPVATYGVSWRDIATPKPSRFLPFEEARAYVHGLGIPTQRAWYAWKERPSFLPAQPSVAYRGKGWVNWRDWLGPRPSTAGGSPSMPSVPVLRLVFDTGDEMVHVDPAVVYKHAVNELLVAVHDNIPTTMGHPGHQLLQDAFTIMSFAGDPYEERLERARALWRRFIETYGTGGLVPARIHPGVLLDVTVTNDGRRTSGARRERAPDPVLYYHEIHHHLTHPTPELGPMVCEPSPVFMETWARAQEPYQETAYDVETDRPYEVTEQRTPDQALQYTLGHYWGLLACPGPARVCVREAVVMALALTGTALRPDLRKLGTQVAHVLGPEIATLKRLSPLVALHDLATVDPAPLTPADAAARKAFGQALNFAFSLERHRALLEEHCAAATLPSYPPGPPGYRAPQEFFWASGFATTAIREAMETILLERGVAPDDVDTRARLFACWIQRVEARLPMRDLRTSVVTGSRIRRDTSPVEVVSIDEVRPTQNDLDPELVARVAALIQDEWDPVVVLPIQVIVYTENGRDVYHVYDGHHRLAAARGNGYREVPVLNFAALSRGEQAAYSRSLARYRRLIQHPLSGEKTVGHDPLWSPAREDRVYLPGEAKAYFNAPRLPLRQRQLGPAWLPPGSPNTKFVYLVRDENNFKEYSEQVFAGAPQEGDLELIQSRLGEENAFEPQDFGLPSLEGLLLQYTAADALEDAGLEEEHEDEEEEEDEEEWFGHEFETIEVTHESPTDTRSWGEFVAEIEQLPARGESGLSCRECGAPMEITPTGIAHHLTPEGDIDYDLDAEHVAIADVEPGTLGTIGARPATKWRWLPASVVYALEPIAAQAGVSRVARHRPAAGGWLVATKAVGESGDELKPATIKAAIRKAEKEVRAPFYAWAYGSGSSQKGGVSYDRTRFTDNGGKSRPGDYGFMAFYDWVTAEGIDPNRYLTSDGLPDEKAIQKLAQKYNDSERFAQWFGDWLRFRHNFLSRHMAQMGASGGFDDDGLPTKRHLGLIMWAGSPAPDRIAKIGHAAGKTAGATTGARGARILLPTPLTYEAAEAHLGNRQARTISRLTEVERSPKLDTRFEPGEIRVTLHGKVIAVLTPSGALYVTSAGYPTVTTRDRLAALFGFQPYVRGGVMYVDLPGGRAVQIPGERGARFDRQEFLRFGESSIETVPAQEFWRAAVDPSLRTRMPEEPGWETPRDLFEAVELLKQLPVKNAALAVLTADQMRIEDVTSGPGSDVGPEEAAQLMDTHQRIEQAILADDPQALRGLRDDTASMGRAVLAGVSNVTAPARKILRRAQNWGARTRQDPLEETQDAARTRWLREWWQRVRRRLAFRSPGEHEVSGRRGRRVRY